VLFRSLKVPSFRSRSSTTAVSKGLNTAESLPPMSPSSDSFAEADVSQKGVDVRTLISQRTMQQRSSATTTTTAAAGTTTTA